MEGLMCHKTLLFALLLLMTISKNAALDKLTDYDESVEVFDDSTSDPSIATNVQTTAATDPTTTLVTEPDDPTTTAEHTSTNEPTTSTEPIAKTESTTTSEPTTTTKPTTTSEPTTTTKPTTTTEPTTTTKMTTIIKPTSTNEPTTTEKSTVKPTTEKSTVKPTTTEISQTTTSESAKTENPESTSAIISTFATDPNNETETSELTTTNPTTTERVLTEDQILVGIKFELGNISLSLEKLEYVIQSTTTYEPVSETSPDTTIETTESTITMDTQPITSKRYLHIVPQVRVAGTEICNPTPKIPEEINLCFQLSNLFDNIETFLNNFMDSDTVDIKHLQEIEGYSQELNSTVEAATKDNSFVQEQIKKEAFINRLTSVQKNVQDASEEVDNRLKDDPPPKDHTLAIVLGTLGGLLGVALIVGTVVFIHKKKKKSSKKGKNKHSDDAGKDNLGAEPTSDED